MGRGPSTGVMSRVGSDASPSTSCRNTSVCSASLRTEAAQYDDRVFPVGPCLQIGEALAVVAVLRMIECLLEHLTREIGAQTAMQQTLGGAACGHGTRAEEHLPLVGLAAPALPSTHTRRSRRRTCRSDPCPSGLSFVVVVRAPVCRFIGAHIPSAPNSIDGMQVRRGRQPVNMRV